MNTVFPSLQNINSNEQMVQIFLVIPFIINVLMIDVKHSNYKDCLP